MDPHAKNAESNCANGFFGPSNSTEATGGHLGAHRNPTGDAGGRRLGPRRNAERMGGFAHSQFGESGFGEWVANPAFGGGREARPVLAEIVHYRAVGDPRKSKTCCFNQGDVEQFCFAVKATVTVIFSIAGPCALVGGDHKVPHAQLPSVLHRFGKLAVGKGRGDGGERSGPFAQFLRGYRKQ